MINTAPPPISPIPNAGLVQRTTPDRIDAAPGIPHFDLPFRFDSTGHAAVVEQSTIEDVTNCVEAAFLTEPGFRVEIPTFGVPEQVFELQPLSLIVLLEAILLWEKRANILMGQAADNSDVLTDRVTAVISLRNMVNNG